MKNFPCGPDPERHIEAIRAYADAGFDELYITQIGSDQEGFIRFYEREVLPEWAKNLVSSGAVRTST